MLEKMKKHGIEKKDLLVPASVLIGAILISLSILEGTGKISLSGGGRTVNTQANQVAGEKVEVAERKGAATMGSGKVEIIEFSDFQCPYCQQFWKSTYKEIKSKYIDTGKAKIIFRHLPLSFHQNAEKAAEAAECANKQGKFFEYHDVLFGKSKSDGTGLDTASLKQYAGDLGLDTQKFNSCLDNGETAEIIKKDIADGQKIGITGTPSFVINGKKIIGAQPISAFTAAIDAALK